MRTLILLILSLIAFKVYSAEIAPSASCDATSKRLENNVVITIPELKVDEYSQTTDELAFKSGFHNDNHTIVGGVTSATPLIQHDIDFNMVILPGSQGVCVKPAINITMGYQSLTVFMDNEIPRSSCIYNAIYSHELHHVAIFKDYLSNNKNRFKQLTDDKFNGRAYYFKSIFEAKQYVQILGEILEQHLKELFINEVNLEQEALDTQAEYSRMQLECLPVGHHFSY